MNLLPDRFGLKTMPKGRRWFVVQSQPRKEFYAGANLERQGFSVFIPRFRKTTRHARQRRTILAPLFTRYLFISLDLGQDRWHSVYGTFGVSCVVANGSWPLPVPVGLVEDLMDVSEHFGVVDLTAALRPGEKVRFLTGPFAETIGRLTELDDAGRARVLLELLGAQREISVSSTTLAPAGDGAVSG